LESGPGRPAAWRPCAPAAASCRPAAARWGGPATVLRVQGGARKGKGRPSGARMPRGGVWPAAVVRPWRTVLERRRRGKKNRRRLGSAFRRSWQARRHRGRDSGWPCGRCGHLARCMRPCVLRHGALRRVAGRGVHGRGAQAQGRGGGPTEVQVHRGDAEASVRRRNRRATRGRRGNGAALWSARRRRSAVFLFHLPVFEIAKLQKSSTKLKISQKQSCRGAVDLQLSRRATYVLINGLPRNAHRSCRFSTAQFTVHSAVNSIFGQFALKIGMSANYEKCVLGNNEQLSYWPILNFYSEIWRTRKKTISAFKVDLGFDRD
jgi:hypothetical protein